MIEAMPTDELAGLVFVSFWRRSVYIKIIRKGVNQNVKFSSPSGGDQFISGLFPTTTIESVSFRLLLAEISLYHRRVIVRM